MARNEAELAALVAAAKSWAGTPFCEGKAAKGAGVACHFGVAEVFFEARWIPRFEVPPGPVGLSRTSSVGLIAPFLEQCEHFQELPVTLGCWPKAAEPGDLLLFKLGHALHHIGILLPGGKLFHVDTISASIMEAIDLRLQRRVARLWRVVS